MVGIAFLLQYCPVISWGYFPHRDRATELRVVMTSMDFSDYELHGQIVSGNVLHPDFKVAGLLEMSTDKSNMQGMVEYQVNKFF